MLKVANGWGPSMNRAPDASRLFLIVVVFDADGLD